MEVLRFVLGCVGIPDFGFTWELVCRYYWFIYCLQFAADIVAIIIDVDISMTSDF